MPENSKQYLPLVAWDEILSHQNNDNNSSPYLWEGHSRFQCALSLLRYGGTPPAHVGLLLYSMGSAISYRSRSVHDLSFACRTETIAEVTGISTKSVGRAFHQLEADSFTSRERQTTSAGTFSTSRVCLKDPATGYILQTHPKKYGLLASNLVHDYIIVPRLSLKAIHKMTTASAKATYLAALAIATRAKRDVFNVDRSFWQDVSGQSRNSFVTGLQSCVGRGLLEYKDGALSLFDPEHPGELSVRTKREFIKHDDPHWEYDLRDITPEEWHTVLEQVLNHPIILSSGWAIQKKNSCPFCGAAKCFSLNFDVAGWRCHHCQEIGRMGQLVQRLLKLVNMDQTKEFIQRVIAERKEVETHDRSNSI